MNHSSLASEICMVTCYKGTRGFKTYTSVSPENVYSPTKIQGVINRKEHNPILNYLFFCTLAQFRATCTCCTESAIFRIVTINSDYRWS
jgi:hypothetical protein